MADLIDSRPPFLFFLVGCGIAQPPFFFRLPLVRVEKHFFPLIFSAQFPLHGGTSLSSNNPSIRKPRDVQVPLRLLLPSLPGFSPTGVFLESF